MVGIGARTRLRTHEVEPSHEFLRCLPVARAYPPPPSLPCAVMRTRMRSGVWFYLSQLSVLFIVVVVVFFFVCKRQTFSGFPGSCAAASVVRPESTDCAL